MTEVPRRVVTNIREISQVVPPQGQAGREVTIVGADCGLASRVEFKGFGQDEFIVSPYRARGDSNNAVTMVPAQLPLGPAIVRIEGQNGDIAESTYEVTGR